MKIDLHVHSKFSTRPSQWILQKLGAPESFSEPERIYEIARGRGMDLVTISDHNRIEGALSIAHLPGTFVSEEITAYFPEDRCKCHVLALNIDEAIHQDIQHVRENVYDHYAQSSHFTNASGVQATCADCHVPHDLQGKVVRKFRGLNELYHHYAGTIGTPEKFEANRARMAEKVWAEFEANDSAACRACHSSDAMTIAAQSAEAQKAHPQAIEQGKTCIACHKGLVHEMPDLSGGYIAMFEDMRRTAQRQGARADTLYPISEKPIFAEASAVDPEARGEGSLLAATELSVLEREGDALRVRVDGWRQQGVDRAIYELMGHRIFSVVLTPAAAGGVTVHETKLDEATDLTWERVSHEFWISDDDLIADLDRIWDYGAEMNQASCATCHSLVAPSHFLANQWPSIVKAKERFTSLDKQQTRMLQKYLQMHAKDTGGADATH